MKVKYVMAYSYGCKAGDDFTFVNPTTMEEKTVKAYISLKSIILTVLIVVCCYALSLLVVRRKAEKVDMIESLKDNRE